MKIVSTAALLALAKFASAGQVANDPSNENIRDADAVLKEHARIDPTAELAAEDDIDKCDAKTHVLNACFDEADEADGLACWEDCVIPASGAFATCDDFCGAVERCRRDKCSSGPACASPYYDVLNCVLEDGGEGAEGCACTGSLEEPEEAPAAEGKAEAAEVEDEGEAVDDDVCDAKTRDLKECFDEAEEADGFGCWNDCVIPASENFDTCDGFCASVERCRSERCSSGPACAARYHEVLECTLEADEPGKCSCAGTLKPEQPEEEVPSAEDAVVAATEEEAMDDVACEADTQELIKCFEEADEANMDTCWDDCVIPASESFATCDGFCTSVEQCRSEKCSSGPTCAAQYRKVLECVLEGPETEGCSCTEFYEQEERSPAVTSTEDAEEDVCPDETQSLIDCFDKNEETDSVGCWEDCVIPAAESSDTCESFCASVEQCRAKRCSSGSACAAQYHRALECTMGDETEGCSCAGTLKPEEPSDGSCASGDAPETCVGA